MVREEGTHDDVNRLVRPERKNIVGDPVNPARGWSSFSGNADCVGTQIEPRQFYAYAAPMGPSLNSAQAIAVAAAHVQNVNGMRIARRQDGFEPMQRRAVAKHPAIDT